MEIHYQNSHNQRLTYKQKVFLKSKIKGHPPIWKYKTGSQGLPTMTWRSLLKRTVHTISNSYRLSNCKWLRCSRNHCVRNTWTRLCWFHRSCLVLRDRVTLWLCIVHLLISRPLPKPVKFFNKIKITITMVSMSTNDHQAPATTKDNITTPTQDPTSQLRTPDAERNNRWWSTPLNTATALTKVCTVQPQTNSWSKSHSKTSNNSSKRCAIAKSSYKLHKIINSHLKKDATID